MHLGNARTALLAWLHSRSQGGQHLLRIEDLDTSRVRPGATDLIRRDLSWLGLDWDSEYIQSERTDLYAAALTTLPTYPCTCTRRQIAETVQASAVPRTAPNPSTPEPAAHAPRLVRTPPCAGRCPTRPSASPTAGPERRCASTCRARWATSWCGAATACTPTSWRWSWTTRPCTSPTWCAGPTCSAAPRARSPCNAPSGISTPRYFHVPLMTDFNGERLAKRGGAPSLQRCVRAWRARRTPSRRTGDLAGLGRAGGGDRPRNSSASTLHCLHNVSKVTFRQVV